MKHIIFSALGTIMIILLILCSFDPEALENTPVQWFSMGILTFSILNYANALKKGDK